MAEQLRENGNEVRIGNVVLRTPGLSGTVEVFEPSGGGGVRAMRGAEGATGALVDALENTRTIELLTIEISDAVEIPGEAGAVRRDRNEEELIEVEVPSAGEKYGQFILATNESGLLSWHLPRTVTNEVDTARGGATQTFLIPRRVLRDDGAAAGASRGVLGAIGKKVLKVIAFRLLDPLIGWVGERFVSKWEARNRPYGGRTFTPGNYRQPLGEAILDEGWDGLASGQALLFIHGTFSRAHSAFGGLEPETVQRLHEKYQGRVFAFEHPTMSDSPLQNVDYLLGQIPDGRSLLVDVVCHSRGGLVTRALVRAASPKIAVRKIVFAATPNAGTILTDARYMGDFIDSYTNILQWFPDNGVTDTLEAIISVVKQLAVGVLGGLDGLQSMLPGGPQLAALAGAIPGAECYAITSNFEPPSGSPLGIRSADHVIDRVFGAENDLVVPTDGVYQWPEAAAFPPARLHVFAGSDAPVHTRYFTLPVTQRLLLRWLT